jgi:ABC-type molybdenum transport system ATPase subunit/photorepair protein PhrA
LNHEKVVAIGEERSKGEESQGSKLGEPLVEMSGVQVSYGNKTVLGNWQQEVNRETKKGLWWTIRRGQRWGIFGPNGSGKTTILSLICSDHPQTYSLPIRLFGRSRLPEPGQPGISVFDIQNRIGHSSPEIHHHMPRRLTLRQTLENAWAETFLGPAQLDAKANAAVEACLRWFEPELQPGAPRHPGEDTAWADALIFGGLPFSAQRVALFLRAVIKKPDLVILDEAFSGMDEVVRDKCMLFLDHGENETFSYAPDAENRTERRRVVPSAAARSNSVVVGGLEPHQALLCISHVREEVPGCVREWICLPEANEGRAARFGTLEGPIEADWARWNDIWGM